MYIFKIKTLNLKAETLNYTILCTENSKRISKMN